MSELLIEIIKNSTLNKNTSTLVESYLLDLPELPFLDELYNMTMDIANNDDIHYTKYYIHFGYNPPMKFMGKSKIEYSKLFNYIYVSH